MMGISAEWLDIERLVAEHGPAYVLEHLEDLAAEHGASDHQWGVIAQLTDLHWLRDDADALRLFELPPPEPIPESVLARKQDAIRDLVAELLAEPDEWDE